jgi:HEAT repeat protein
MSRNVIATLLCLLLWSLSHSVAADLNSQVQTLLGPPVQTEQLRALGPGVMPVMAQIYTASDEQGRTRIASTFYQLGWPSQDAYQALMQDIRTTNPQLRLQVQWALGKVSGEDEVVDTLLEIMRNDKTALFRDKAACALAYDQVHLNEEQKADLFSGLIDGLDDPKPQVRKISIQALKIHTGQTKGFSPTASETQRARSVQEWRGWLAEYRANL